MIIASIVSRPVRLLPRRFDGAPPSTIKVAPHRCRSNGSSPHDIVSNSERIMDRLTGMTVFRRVVELDGFAAAARDLRMSGATVSKHVARLEEGLGVRLLNRTTRRLSPTEAGRAYYERSVRILDDIADAEPAITRDAASPRGLLRVSEPMSFGVRHIGPVDRKSKRLN